jgi:2-keto-4-pentenoate hydratase/2-oxohepta-3-ene-1,7-dioic acid hydratase in catechol pathway
MRLATYDRAGEKRAGILVNEFIIDLEEASLDTRCFIGETEFLPASLRQVLEQGDDALEQCSRIESYFAKLSSKDYPRQFCTPLREAKLAPPIPDPQKIVCIGMNYRDHCEEQKKPLPDRPIIFAKFPSALIGHNEPIVKPPLTSQLDYEAELAVIIGRRGKNVPEEEALSCVSGYTIMNDVTARDIQFSDGQWVRGKTFDTFAPAGPYLVTRDEIPDPQDLTIELTVNGEVRQNSTTSNMIFSVAFLISYISQVCTLLPGDIVSTGTPGGVGVFRKPPLFLKAGDTVSVEIERLGTLTNWVVEP